MKTSAENSSLLVLSNVLLVPELGHVNLMSWKAMQKVNKNLFLYGTGDDIFVKKGSLSGEIVVWARLEGNDWIIQQQNDTAQVASYDEFHQALGHVSAPYIRSDSYSDGHLIPPCPKAFHCHVCKISNSTKKIPLPAACATRPFELIHSDLSGKFSVES